MLPTYGLADPVGDVQAGHVCKVPKLLRLLVGQPHLHLVGTLYRHGYL